MRMYGAVCGSIYPCNAAAPAAVVDELAPKKNSRGSLVPRKATRTRKRVMVVDTGEVYRSIRSAAQALGVSKSRLAIAVSEGVPCCGFEVVEYDGD